MSNEFSKIFAFLRKSYLIERSYRFAFIFQIFGIFFSVAMFYYIGQILGPRAHTALREYGGDYFHFVLIGIAIQHYIGIAVYGYSSQLSREQNMGTLESLLLTPTRVRTIVIAPIVWEFVVKSAQIFVYFGCAIIFFSFPMTRINFISAGFVIVVTVLAYSQIGIIAAAFILVFKRGNPIQLALGILHGLLGGIYFPVSLLPDWIQRITDFIPLVHALHALRLAILNNATVYDIRGELGILCAFFTVLIPITTMAFRSALRQAKKDGSLAHF